MRNFIIIIIISAFTFASCGSDNNKPATKTVSNHPTSDSPVKPDTVSTPTVTRCFTNEGLKYKTVLSVTWRGNAIRGSAASEALDGSSKQLVNFTGTATGNQLSIEFAAPAPVVGGASEWTGKPWTLDITPGKEKLSVPFKAKNHNSNKWEETPFEFSVTPCQ